VDPRLRRGTGASAPDRQEASAHRTRRIRERARPDRHACSKSRSTSAETLRSLCRPGPARVAARWLLRYLEEDPETTIDEAVLGASCLAALPGFGEADAAQRRPTLVSSSWVWFANQVLVSYDLCTAGSDGRCRSRPEGSPEVAFPAAEESAWRVPGHLGKPGVTHHNEACRVGSLPSPEHGGAAHHLDSEL
jgi:hypothetical protein